MAAAAKSTLEALQDILGHSFTDEDLLEQALRHASTTEQRTKSNERLEFLGDRVLGLVIAETCPEMSVIFPMIAAT